ncbi:MAG: PEP/pyruvate-binding domain-containing protein [Desulfobacterales bacterium]|nr:PEP/pyruvate-binding domain-containing protein [Desulfobacterales bacterium]
MNWIIAAENIGEGHGARVGGKGQALALLARGGFRVPKTLCVTSDTYREYVSRTGLRERILLELNRKAFKEMRWEEIWDCATRIRNMFLRKPIPDDISSQLKPAIHAAFKDKAVVVRSSAPEEDDAASSFAGLHESYVNIQGTAAILEHIAKVWASLWSDAALLYRQEIGLDVKKSAMAVVIQEIVVGEKSGVAFSQSPNDRSQGIIESVYGLNQGLVDGAVEPDRWILDRQKKTIISHTPADRKRWAIAADSGVRLDDLPQNLAHQPPLNTQETHHVFELALEAENYFKSPQDMEWTFRRNDLVVLQSRPITTLSTQSKEDDRSWYLSLHRSFDNLKRLRQKIENELIPAMIGAADDMGQQNLTELSDEDLAAEINHRWEINQKWTNIYWEEFIPYAHGVRLFGQIYNDAMHPEDPYEFIDLLTHTEMASLERNQMLADLAKQVRKNPSLANALNEGQTKNLDAAFLSAVDRFVEKFGDLTCAVTGGTQCEQAPDALYKILLEMAAHLPAEGGRQASKNKDALQQKFLSMFEGDQKQMAGELLDLARSSYQLRDDDNIYLGRIEAQLLAAVREARQRIDDNLYGGSNKKIAAELLNVVESLDHRPQFQAPYKQKPEDDFVIQARQLIGQPAGPGLAKGPARVIQQNAELAEFKYGEILICDAVDPNMTFVVPLAAGVVERRGGMLIHGAIIAREYGLPCVTGIPDATKLIQNGDEVTVDGYLGIVTIGSEKI